MPELRHQIRLLMYASMSNKLMLSFEALMKKNIFEKQNKQKNWN